MNQIKLKNISLSSFGVLSNTNLNFNDKNFILIYGENEAGKSTLFNFIRYNISGFPHHKSTDFSHYETELKNNNLSKITANFESVDFNFSRESKKNKEILIEEANNVKLSKDFVNNLKNIFNSTNIKEYRSIFAFNINDIYLLDFLSDSSIGEKLISTAIQGENDLILRASNILKSNHEILLRKKGSTKTGSKIEEINSKILLEENKLKELNNLLYKYKKDETEYEKLLINIENIKNEINEIKNQLVFSDQLLTRKSPLDKLKITKDKIDNIRDVVILNMIDTDSIKEKLSKVTYLKNQNQIIMRSY